MKNEIITIKFQISLIWISILAVGGFSPVRSFSGNTPGNPKSASTQINEIVQNISEKKLEEHLTRLVSFETRHSLSDTVSSTRGIGAARRWIYEQFQNFSQASGGRLKVAYQTFEVDRKNFRRYEHFKVQMKNVLAILPGSMPAAAKRMFVVGGHYDTVAFNRESYSGKGPSNGANDDGSGTAVVIELARVLSQYEFDATLVFVAYAGEEQGLFGSTYHAQEARKQNLQIDGMITNDIVGNILGGDGSINNTELRCFSEEPWDSPSRQMARHLKRVAEPYVNNLSINLIFRRDRYGRGGDHIPFNQEGYAAIRLSEPNENYDRQHSLEDKIEFVSFPYLTKVARLNAAALASLALAPAAPENVKLSRTRRPPTAERPFRQGYEVKFTWEHKMAEPDLQGFKIAIRKTTDATYQKYIPTGKVKEFTLTGYSIDNYAFGVIAYDKDGNESLIAAPAPRPSRRKTRFTDEPSSENLN
ncbi:MAG: M20/M25/M40 family metallo-hydrolase [bacterium]